jgi:hypothetical protein
MALPQFLDIEFTESEGRLIPVAAAWSLADGRIKAVVIMPDESWLPDDPEDLAIDLVRLQEHGVPAIDAVQEMTMDLADRTVFTDGVDPDDILVELLFSAFNQDPNFETAPMTALITSALAAELDDRRRELCQEHDLEPDLPESTVMSLLLLARDYGELPGQ